jgi:hypothetical protein
MNRLETWDKLENAISAAVSMAAMLILAGDHDRDLIDFAINDMETRVAAVKDLYYKLHREVHHRGERGGGPIGRVKNPRRSERARQGWEKRRARTLVGRSHKLLKAVDNVVPLR